MSDIVYKNSSSVNLFYKFNLLNKIDLNNKTVLLLCLGNIKTIKEICAIAKNVIIIDTFFIPQNVLSGKYFMCINNNDILNIIGKLNMKFDSVVMNPPFCNGLHLKILQSIIPTVDFKHGGRIECIHPAVWLQFPTRERPTYMNGLINNFDMFERKNANETFNIDGGDLVITSLSANGLKFSGDAVSDNFFCCFKYNSRFASNWKIVKSIYEKIISKCPVGTYQNKLCNNPNLTYSLRLSTTRSATMPEHEKGGTTGFRIVSQKYDTAKQIHIAGGIKFLNFNTEQERYNAWQSYLTKFARFCVAMDESTKLVPYMEDYSQTWDDKRFYKYFELTEEEIAVIEETIK